MQRFKMGDTVYFGSLIGKVAGLIGPALPMDDRGNIPLPLTPSEVKNPVKYEVQFRNRRRMRLLPADLSRWAPAPIVTNRAAG